MHASGCMRHCLTAVSVMPHSSMHNYTVKAVQAVEVLIAPQRVSSSALDCKILRI